MQSHFPASSRPWKARALSVATLVVQMLLLALAFYLALATRFDFKLTTPEGIRWLSSYFLPLLPLVIGIKLTIWLALGLHTGATTWRYTSLRDALRLLAASIIALGIVLAAYNLTQILFLAHSVLGGPNGSTTTTPRLPETLFLVDWLFSISLLTALRFSARLLYEESRPIASAGLTRLLIIGAGQAAAALLREIDRLPEQRYRIVGLLDDSPALQKTRLHNIPVLGPISALPALARQHQIAEILIAIPSATNDQMQRIISLCRTAQMQSDQTTSPNAAPPIRFRTLPSLHDILIGAGSGKTTPAAIRDISVNDLLGRDAVNMDLAAVGAMLHRQVVLVSGAGGSIGSELCRTIARFEPASLVLLDKAENAIFEIERELKKSFPGLTLIAAIGDISDAIRVDQIFNDYLPHVVFHAAAHKHVPLAESNPGECIRNNVFGTKVLADAALAGGVKNFVMISTDKAVNPSSIMGATKRCAELYIQSLARRQQKESGPWSVASEKNASSPLTTDNRPLTTNFTAVRFGNVLGSNGSVVPIFKQQIAAGGPVTVTHPEMRRYFMTIPEAAQLVLQAAALGNRGEIFTLDMGKPVRILDLARDLIILSGLRPDLDIPIVFTGLRPGEKLYEELSITGEHMVPTRHPKIAIFKSGADHAGAGRVQKMIDDLEPLQHCTRRPQILATLQHFIPEMKPWQPEMPPIRTRSASEATSPLE